MKFFLTFNNLIKIFKEKNIQYIFYSENKVYRNNFYDFIVELSKIQNEYIFYISSDVHDVINIKNVKNFYIGRGIIRLFFFYYVRCKFFFMTLTDLGNSFLRKSNNVHYYVYIFHSPISLHRSYTPKAFNNYDIFFSIGNRHTNELKKILKINRKKNKLILNIGYFYFDFLKNKINLNKLKKNTFLVAPSWNYNSINFLNTSCKKIIESLLSNNFNVIFRPHPEHYKRNAKDLINIINTFSKYKNFFFDQDFSNLNSLNSSEFLITDNSGIAIEFCLVLKRPVFYFDSNLKLHNINYFQISRDTIEDNVKKKFGKIIKVSDLNNIQKIVNNHKFFFNNHFLNKIDLFINENFYNFNNSVKYATKKIINFR